MTPDQLQQVSEIVKNINIGFDGTLNSETLVQAAQQIMPYFWMVQIKSLVVHFAWAGAVVLSAYFIGRALLTAVKEAE